jgi:hypothetical protein
MKITPHHIKETINLIVSSAIREYKVSLANFHSITNLNYRDFDHCLHMLDACKKQSHDRLQGIQYLILEERQYVSYINNARNAITEEYGLFMALLTTGKHSKDAVLDVIKELEQTCETLVQQSHEQNISKREAA